MPTEKPYLALLDAFPGAGKTHTFREIIFDSLSMDSAYTRGFVFVYVAPTKILCEEVYQSVCNQWKAYVISQADESAPYKEFVASHLHKVWVGSDPTVSSSTQSLNELLGTAISSSKPLKPRNVIFTTHEAFSRVKNAPTAYPTWVFFDEARQCLGKRDMIKLPLSVAPKILKPFSPTEVHVKEPLKDTSKIPRKVYKLHLPKSGKLDTPLNGDATPTVLNAVASLKTLMKKTEEGRSSVYILAPEAAVVSPSTTSRTSSEKSISIFAFQNSEGMFQNYERVTIMSAFFKDSQMFHSLKKHYHIIDILRPPVDMELPKWIKHSIVSISRGGHNPKTRNHLLKLHAGSRLKVVPLLSSEFDSDDFDDSEKTRTKNTISISLDEITNKSRLSKNVLSSGLLVSPKVQEAVIRYVESNDLPMTHVSVIESVWLHWYALKTSTEVRKAVEKYWGETYGKPYRDHVPNLYALLEPFLVDKKTDLPMFPGWVLTRQANVLSKKIALKFNTEEIPLLVYNAGTSKLPYTPIPKRVLAKVGLPQESFPVEDTQTFLRERFKEAFSIPATPVLNGLNTWQKSDHFVHLAALNPQPDVILLMKHVLPKYDADYDFLLENVVQTMYRTSLRNPSLPETSPVFLYITKSVIGRLLSQRLKLCFEIFNFEHHGIQRKDLVELHFSTEASNTLHQKRAAKSRTKYDPETAKEIRSVQTGMRRYTILEKEGKTLTSKQAAKLKELRKTLHALQKGV